jgi:predicted nucleotidyltransferase
VTPSGNGAFEAKIDRMVRRIVNRFDPESVVLFGSRARGEAGPDSDVDLLVVMPVQGSKRRKRVEIRVALHKIHWPQDILLATPEECALASLIPGSIVRSAAWGQVFHLDISSFGSRLSVE